VAHTGYLMAASTNPPEPPAPTTGTVRSADDTVIGFYRMGQGPAVILLHGAGQTGENLRSLADGLAGAFTVYVPDRRGRGRSGPYGQFPGLRTEIEDLSALLDATGARCVFGLSAGAVIAIEAALTRPQIARLALYEPPLSFNGVQHASWVSRYERELQAGKLGPALITVMKGTADRTAFRYVPAIAERPVRPYRCTDLCTDRLRRAVGPAPPAAADSARDRQRNLQHRDLCPGGGPGRAAAQARIAAGRALSAAGSLARLRAASAEPLQ
jgi:pimeloyl-ACP methyl ester carboxylesterase